VRWCLTLGVLILTGSSAHADRVALGDDTLKQALSGKTVDLDTPFGVAVPITFHGNGLMSGKAGALAYFLGGESDRGRWWVTEGRLCQKWFKWLDAKPSCMRLQQDGQRIFWQRDDGVSGTATIVTALPPGAEAGPRGLGGPIQPTQGEHSLATAEAPKSRTIPVTAASFHRAMAHSTSIPATPAASDSHRQRPSLVGNHSNSVQVHAPPLAGPQSDVPSGQEKKNWCHSARIRRSGALADPTASPGLLFVARLLYGGTESPRPTNACFTADPPLQAVARIGAGTR